MSGFLAGQQRPVSVTSWTDPVIAPSLAMAAESLCVFGGFLVVSIVAGMVCAGIWIQQGYASGAAEIVVGTLNAAAPVAGVAYGIAVLGEGVNITPRAAAMMVLFAIVAIWGVVLLSRFHPGAGETDPRRADTDANAV